MTTPQDNKLSAIEIAKKVVSLHDYPDGDWRENMYVLAKAVVDIYAELGGELTTKQVNASRPSMGERRGVDNKLTAFLEEMKKYSDHASCDDACSHRPDKDYWIKLIKMNEILLDACEFYSSLGDFKPTHPCDVDVRFQIESGGVARKAIEKCKEIIG